MGPQEPSNTVTPTPSPNNKPVGPQVTAQHGGNQYIPVSQEPGFQQPAIPTPISGVSSSNSPIYYGQSLIFDSVQNGIFDSSFYYQYFYQGDYETISNSHSLIVISSLSFVLLVILI